MPEKPFQGLAKPWDCLGSVQGRADNEAWQLPFDHLLRGYWPSVAVGQNAVFPACQLRYGFFRQPQESDQEERKALRNRAIDLAWVPGETHGPDIGPRVPSFHSPSR